MNGKKITRIALDSALTVMLVAEMFIQFTGVVEEAAEALNFVCGILKEDFSK